MNITQIKETCLYVDNLDKAEQFYHGLMEFPLISKVEDRHAFFRCGTSVLLCFLPEVTENEPTLPPHFAEGKQHIAFEVARSDYEQTKAKLLDKGLGITHIQDWGDGLESFYFDDPFGHVLEVVPKGIWEKS